MSILDKKYAIRHKPTNMFLAKYENDYTQEVKGATGKLTPRAIPHYTKLPRFYNSASSANNVISRVTRTKDTVRKDKTMSLLFGSETSLDYEIVEIDISWEVNKVINYEKS